MRYTRHAKQRTQERGIPRSVANLVLKYGTAKPQENGLEQVTLLPRDKRAAIRQLRQKLQSLENASNVVVIADEDNVVTTYRELR